MVFGVDKLMDNGAALLTVLCPVPERGSVLSCIEIDVYWDGLKGGP